MKIFLRTLVIVPLSLTLIPCTVKAGGSQEDTPEGNFEDLWQTFYNSYAFFTIRGTDWLQQYEIYRPQVTAATTDLELFDIMCQMLKPLNDGHVELFADSIGEYFNPETEPRFRHEFTDPEIEQLFELTGTILADRGFSEVKDTATWTLRYAKSADYAYLRIVELEGVRMSKLTKVLDDITEDFDGLKGYIIDLRDCPGGEDSVLLKILNRFTDERRVAFHRKTKIGPGEDDWGELGTWYIYPEGASQFTGPIILLTCDSVFSGGDAFALVARELPHVTIVGENTNGIFSYQLEKTLPNGWDYNLSYQMYLSADMVCYESIGIPVDIEVLNTMEDLIKGEDAVLNTALNLLDEKTSGTAYKQ